MKRLQNATLCVIGVICVVALYLSARGPSMRLADIAARLDVFETHLADYEKLHPTHASLTQYVDCRGVIRDAEGNLVGHWGVDDPLRLIDFQRPN
jgi:hypothetical protein